MARIAGVDLPKNKRIEIGLTYIYGIGRTTSNRILGKLKINPDTRTDKLSESEVSSIRKVIDSEYKVEGELRTQISMNIERLMDQGATVDFVTENRFRSMGSVPAPMQGREKGPSARQ